MLDNLFKEGRRRVPLKYAAIAAAVAIVSVVAIETAGTALKSSYSGLGGKLTPSTSGGPEVTPARTTVK